MNGWGKGNYRGGKKKRTARQSGSGNTSVITPSKEDDPGEDGDAPGRGGLPRSTPNRSSAKARRTLRRCAQSRSASDQPCCPPSISPTADLDHDLRVLVQGGKAGRLPRPNVASDYGWNQELLNTGEPIPNSQPTNSLEYDSHYQRLREWRDTVTINNAHSCKQCVLDGCRIIDIGKLTSFITNKTACRNCSTRASVQLAVDFADMLDAKSGMSTRSRSGPSYREKLRHYLRRRGGYAKSVSIPSFTTVGESTNGFASVIHFECSGAIHSCDMDGNDLTRKTADGVPQPRSRFSSHRTLLHTSARTSLQSQSRWPCHPKSTVDADKEPSGQAG